MPHKLGEYEVVEMLLESDRLALLARLAVPQGKGFGGGGGGVAVLGDRMGFLVACEKVPHKDTFSKLLTIFANV